MRTRTASPSKLLMLLKFPTEGIIEVSKAAEIFAEAIARIESNSSLNVSSVHPRCKSVDTYTCTHVSSHACTVNTNFVQLNRAIGQRCLTTSSKLVAMAFNDTHSVFQTGPRSVCNDVKARCCRFYMCTKLNLLKLALNLRFHYLFLSYLSPHSPQHIR